MKKFKIEYFCEHNNKLFKKYYNMLNNKYYIFYFTLILKFINTNNIIKNKILLMIQNNNKYILERLDIIDTIVHYYKENNLINKSEIGKFFSFYQKNIKNINKEKDNDLFKLFYILINYKDVLNVLKECFYIFSDYRACIYFMTPSINFNNTDKKTIHNVILNFRDNINTLNQIISRIYLGDENSWGSIYYSSAKSMFETLIIIKKYFKDPLKELNIKFDILKKCINKNILKKLCINYHKNKLSHELNDSKINVNNINNVSHFIINIKKLGYDMWFVIPLVFNTIFEKYEISKILEPNLINCRKIMQQKINNLLGIMCYILVSDGYISNVNIFNNFND